MKTCTMVDAVFQVTSMDGGNGGPFPQGIRAAAVSASPTGEGSSAQIVARRSRSFRNALESGGLLLDSPFSHWALLPSPLHPMLWNISHPFQSIVEAGPDLASARLAMIEKIKADPGAFITKIAPAEPSAKNLLDVVKRAVGM